MNIRYFLMICLLGAPIFSMQKPSGLIIPVYVSDYPSGALDDFMAETNRKASLAAGLPDINLMRKLSHQNAWRIVYGELLPGKRLSDLGRSEFFDIVKKIHMLFGGAIYNGVPYCLYSGEVEVMGKFKHELNLSDGEGFHVADPLVNSSFEELMRDSRIAFIYAIYRQIGSAVYAREDVRNLLLEKRLYFPPLPREVPGKLDAFFKTIIDHKMTWSAVKMAAYVHNELIRIHPFYDGDGRVARAVMNIFLAENNIKPVVFASNREYLAIGLRAMITGDDTEFEQYLERTIAERCAMCPLPADKHCSRCRKANYCAAACQKKDWPEHKKVCVPAPNLSVPHVALGAPATGL